MNEPKNANSPDVDVRPHVYDGIREYNHRLPNWWLFTLYGAIAFAVGYWSYYEWFHGGPDSRGRLEAAMIKVEAAKLSAAAASKIDDTSLWAMSRNPVFTAAGRQTFEANCTPCHLASLRGKSENPQAIGPDLTDQIWIHGGRPEEVYHTITTGVAAKGMPTWGPILGTQRITELVAYICSYHKEGEPIIDAAAQGSAGAK